MPNELREMALSWLRESLSVAHAEFRPDQWETIDAVANRRARRMVVQATGWGKSSVYFIATRILREMHGAGPTIIVSPLLALMRNQIAAARRLGVVVGTINSQNEPEWPIVEQQWLKGEVDALLLSPERLANQAFADNVLAPTLDRIGLLVVDEAHCISDWGHDFRPDYRRLLNLLRRMPANLPLLATTATANDRVIDDVQQQLGSIAVSRGPLVRPSLTFQVMPTLSRLERLAWLAHAIRELSGSGIAYTLTIRDAEQVAEWLRRNQIEAHAYHSQLEAAERLRLEDGLMDNSLKVLVATSALGMGFDKPDLAFVVHFQAPGSVIAYYQQAGRAGRAISRAHAILMPGNEDDEILDYFRRTAFPAEEQLESILKILEKHGPFSTRQLEAHVNMPHGAIEHALKFMSVENPSPVLYQDKKWSRTAVHWRLDKEQIARLTAQREREWAELKEYERTTGCRMEFLVRALDDPQASRCGKCDNCLGGDLLGAEVSAALVEQARSFTMQRDSKLVPKVRIPAGVLPDGKGRSIPKEFRASEGRTLSHWKDGALGDLVAEGKHLGRFADQLVEAMARMIEDRWKPSPPPAWVTCIPSKRHPRLVPDFAERLAVRLGLPFLPVVTRQAENEAQKLMRNSVHQCRNVLGVFAVILPLGKGPVLLVDDAVDSRWTLTAASYKLLQAGSGPVFPVALTSTSNQD